MATFTQGPRPDPYAGTRRWHELTLEEQDKFLLACGFGDASWNDAIEPPRVLRRVFDLSQAAIA